MPIQMTVDEAISALKRSSLPTIVTEGRDDYLLFRRLEEKFNDISLDVISLGGRSSVLEIFDRRQEIGRNDVVFFVDQDFWLFSGIPNTYQHRKLLLTDGYSIENDVYRDGDVENLMTAGEKRAFQHELGEVLKWYCFAVAQNSAGVNVPIKTSLHVVLRNGHLCPIHCAGISYTMPTNAALAGMSAVYKSHLRGKTLLSLISRQLNDAKRWPKYSYHQLIEISVVKEGFYFNRIKDAVASLFSQIYGRPISG